MRFDAPGDIGAKAARRRRGLILAVASAWEVRGSPAVIVRVGSHSLGRSAEVSWVRSERLKRNRRHSSTEQREAPAYSPTVGTALAASSSSGSAISSTTGGFIGGFIGESFHTDANVQVSST